MLPFIYMCSVWSVFSFFYQDEKLPMPIVLFFTYFYLFLDQVPIDLNNETKPFCSYNFNLDRGFILLFDCKKEKRMHVFKLYNFFLDHLTPK